MKLIVCLGNPGEAYRDTRHNVGFMLGDRLAEHFDVKFKAGRGAFDVAEFRFKGRESAIIMPNTFMNESGTAVRKALAVYGAEPKDCLVCHDELDLPVGTVRFRAAGSAGGHNGVQDIIDKIGTREFPRLRIGIGRDFPPGMQVQYVLSRFPRAQRELIDSTLSSAVEGLLVFLRSGIDMAMNAMNRTVKPTTQS